jgi:hypothetical protein
VDFNAEKPPQQIHWHFSWTPFLILILIVLFAILPIVLFADSRKSTPAAPAMAMAPPSFSSDPLTSLDYNNDIHQSIFHFS